MVDLTLPVGKVPGCDFCHVGNTAVKEYPCENFELGTFMAPDLPTQTTNSIGNWFACEECAKLIDLDERDALVKRAASELLKATHLKDYPSEKLRRGALTAIIVAHAGFFAHRKA